MRGMHSSATIDAVKRQLDPDHPNAASKTITVAHQLHLSQLLVPRRVRFFFFFFCLIPAG